ncbi:MAG: DUF1697 domain-containing protein [SAR202 cluster bacterium]|nr:DUF1697 domain-containing protein [SAR202 cluster bacterium]
MAKLKSYVAFLRGINVGGNKIIKMEDLRRAFESLGLQNVKTILASGNVIFETEKPSATLAGAIQAQLKKSFGFDVGVTLRSIAEIQDVVDLDPFKGIAVTPQTRLYVTFLPDKPGTAIKTPVESPEKHYRILQIANGAVFSVLTLTPNTKSTDLMGMLDKTFGKKVTTRNWNTIAAILKSSK